MPLFRTQEEIHQAVAQANPGKKFLTTDEVNQIIMQDQEKELQRKLVNARAILAQKKAEGLKQQQLEVSQNTDSSTPSQ